MTTGEPLVARVAMKPIADEVYAKASSRSPSSFVRVMIVPVAYRGRPTITYVRPEDASKPKSQTYKRYLEHAIAL